MRGVRVKARHGAFSITFGFITKYFPTIRPIYILNNVPETASNLPKAPMLSVRRLSAKRLGRGGTLGRPRRRSSFLRHIRQPFFRARPTQAFSHIRASFMRDDG